MKDFFDGMSNFEQTYWIIALVGSAIFGVIFIMTFLGADGDADMEADATDFEADDGGVGFQFFTFKNIVAFFTLFGWTGVSCIDNECTTTITIIVSTIAGLIMMGLTTMLFFWINQLAEAIKNIKIDKVTVWENGGAGDGKTATSNFISGMYKAVPPLQEMFNMAGMQLPNYLKGDEVEDVQATEEEKTEE